MPIVGPEFKVPQLVFEIWTFLKGARFGAPPLLPTYTTAQIPAAADHTGGIIFVSDAAAGSQFQGSNGTSWVALG